MPLFCFECLLTTIDLHAHGILDSSIKFFDFFSPTYFWKNSCLEGLIKVEDALNGIGLLYGLKGKTKYFSLDQNAFWISEVHWVTKFCVISLSALSLRALEKSIDLFILYSSKMPIDSTFLGFAELFLHFDLPSKERGQLNILPFNQNLNTMFLMSMVVGLNFCRNLDPNIQS